MMCPALTVKQRRAMAIALHNPSKLRRSNRRLKKLKQKQLQEFAETDEQKLPKKRKKR